MSECNILKFNVITKLSVSNVMTLRVIKEVLTMKLLKLHSLLSLYISPKPKTCIQYQQNKT